MEHAVERDDECRPKSREERECIRPGGSGGVHEHAESGDGERALTERKDPDDVEARVARRARRVDQQHEEREQRTEQRRGPFDAPLRRDADAGGEETGSDEIGRGNGNWKPLRNHLREVGDGREMLSGKRRDRGRDEDGAQGTDPRVPRDCDAGKVSAIRPQAEGEDDQAQRGRPKHGWFHAGLLARFDPPSRRLGTRRWRSVSGRLGLAGDVVTPFYRLAGSAWVILDAATAAPNPLSMFTTVTPAAQLLSIVSSAAIPPNEAP